MDIAFYYDKIVLDVFKEPIVDDKKNHKNNLSFTKMNINLLRSLADTVLKISDLILLKQRGQITEKDFKKILPILQKKLLDTI